MGALRWPEMMLKRDAAEYCSLSIAKFEQEVLAGRLPGPVRFGGKEHWRKSAIDRALDIITGDMPMMGDEAPYRKKLRDRYAPDQAA